MSLILNYNENISKKLVQEFDLKNSMAAPKVKKVVVNMGIGALRDNKDEQEKISQELGQIKETLAKGKGLDTSFT